MKKFTTRSIISVIVIILIIFATLYLFQSNKPHSDLKTSKIKLNDVDQMISYNSLGLNFPIKAIISTSTENNYYTIISIYNIGKFVSGEYSGKNLSIASFHEESTEEPLTDTIKNNFLRNNDIRNFAVPYIYFVSDEQGNPVAIDKELLHNLFYCQIHYEKNTDINCLNVFLSKLGMNKFNEKKLVILYKKYKQAESYGLNDNIDAGFDYLGSDIFSEDINYFSDKSNIHKVGTTSNGFSVVAIPTPNRWRAQNYPTDISQRMSYAIEYPFGAYGQVIPSANFVLKNGTAKVKWNNNINALYPVYNSGVDIYYWQDCYYNNNLPISKFESSIIQTGKTQNGGPVFEVNPITNDAVYRCLYKNRGKYISDPVSHKIILNEITYEDFVNSHPMFFWKHPAGEWIVFELVDALPNIQ